MSEQPKRSKPDDLFKNLRRIVADALAKCPDNPEGAAKELLADFHGTPEERKVFEALLTPTIEDELRKFRAKRDN